MIENFQKAVIGGEGNGSPMFGASTTTATISATNGFVAGTVGTGGTGFSNHNMDISTSNVNEQ